MSPFSARDELILSGNKVFSPDFTIEIFDLFKSQNHGRFLRLYYDTTLEVVRIKKRENNSFARIILKITRLLVSGRSPECSDCLLRFMEQ